MHLEDFKKELIQYRQKLEELGGILGDTSKLDNHLVVFDKLLTRITQDAEFAHQYSSLSFFERVKVRIIPIFITFVMELIVAVVFASFEETISKYPLLAAFLPTISAISGNNGLISSTVIVRGLAVGTERRTFSVILREIEVSFITGLFFGILGGLFCLLVYKSPLMAVVVLCATTLSLTTSGFAGSFAPTFFSWIGVDPARYAGPLESNFQDLVTYTIYLTLLSILPKYFPPTL